MLFRVLLLLLLLLLVLLYFIFYILPLGITLEKVNKNVCKMFTY